MPNHYCLEVSGDFACFTRPEMKVERVSYDVMTPSAARAIFEAIFWKPAVQWRIIKIEVINPIRWINVRRNEVGKVFIGPTPNQIQENITRDRGFFIEDERQQRAGLFLRDVKYRIYASLIFDQERDPGSNYAKYTNIFERRAEKGQCFNQPYLGCREFSCDFRLIKDIDQNISPILETRSLGWMLYDMDYSDLKNIRPRFFEAKMNAGTVEVPLENSREIRG